MLFRPFAFAAAAAAFLVVPEIKEPEEDTFKTLPLPIHAEPFEVPSSALSQSLEVPCVQCKGKDTNLRFDFAVEEGKALTLNGFELYPSPDPWHGDLSAAVIKDNGKEKDQRLGYSLAVMPEGMDEELKMEVIGIEVKVLEVGNRFIDGIPTIKVKVIKAATNEIVIGTVELKDASETTCDSMWCRTKDMFDGLFKGMKGCAGGRHKAHHKGHKGHGEHASADGAEGHHRQGGHHQHHGMKHHGHRWGKIVKNIATHIFFPVLMGVAAGIGVAMCSMFVCTIAVRLMTLVKGGRCERSWCTRGRAAQTEVAVDEEKSGLMEHQDPPPQYEDDAKN